MKVVITGLPQAGQQQLFSLLTGISLETITQKSFEVQLGVCEVKDDRIAKLSALFNPKKTTFAKIEYALLPDFILQGPTKNLILNELKNADEISWVVRSATADTDIVNFISELIIADLMLVEKRLDNLAKEQRKKYSEMKEKEVQLIEMCKKQLEAEKPLRDMPVNDEQQKFLRTFQFYTLKPIVLVINVPENQNQGSSVAEEIKNKYHYPTVQLSAELEEEINQLPEAERAEFMKEIGIEEPALNKMTRIVFEGLGYFSFFTVGEDEVRAWPVRKGSTAAEAGAVIHSDIEKGFVRAELMKYADFIAAGSEAKVKELGKFSLKGRDYIVEDGDILSFRFNV